MTILERVVAERVVTERVARPTRTTRTVVRRQPGRRSSSPLARLSREHDAACVFAVDPYEIAAWLESQGMSDQACARYGHPGVFSLAEALFAMVPRRGATRVTAVRRQPTSTAGSLLHGLIYALPGLAGFGLLTQGADAAVVMLVVLAVGWGWTNAASHLGHRRLGWEGRAAARVVLRRGLVGGVVLMLALVPAVGWAIAAPPALVGVGLGLGWYMVGAAALLVLGHDRLLLVALLPGSVGGLLAVLHVQPWGQSGSFVLPGLSVLGTLALAWVATAGARALRPAGQPNPANRRTPLNRADADAASGHLVYGVLCAIAVGAGPVTLAILDGRQLASVWYVMLPLVLSMGPMEVQLERLRSRTSQHLWQLADPAQFRRRAGQSLIGSVGAIVALVAVIALLCGLALRDDPPGVVAVSGTLLLGYSLLAACLFVGLILASTGGVKVAAAAVAGALTAYLGLAALLPTAATVAYVAVLAVLLPVLFGLALLRSHSPFVHL
jgi:hypothetical protein